MDRQRSSALNQSSWAILSALGASAAVAIAVNACSGAATPNETSGIGGSSGTSTGKGGAGSTSTDSASTGEGGTNLTATGAGGGTTCNSGTANDDSDHDGFTEAQGDCNDCNKFQNPDAVEVIAEADGDGGTPKPADEDCDGKVDVLADPCDDALVQNSEDPMDAAKAIGACKFVTKATWVQADGSPPPADATHLANFHLGHGILPDFGASNPPQEGARMLVLSSGTARKKGDPEYVHRNFDKGYQGSPPFGFPKASPSCPEISTDEIGAPHDATGLELQFKAPSNAQGIAFDFNFFTFEWPKFICTNFNDFFIANLFPFPAMQTDGNISFDSQGNPVSVNNAFLDVCKCPSPPCFAPPGTMTKKFDCSLGVMSVSGTDFDKDDSNPGWSNGATGWLRTSAPVSPGQTFTIRFVTYDSSDGNVDSTTLIDNWQWSATPGTVKTEPPH